jgi:hypothetical protein
MMIYNERVRSPTVEARRDQCVKISSEEQDHRGHRGSSTATVKLDVDGTIVATSIANAAVHELKRTKRHDAYAVVKAAGEMRLTRLPTGVVIYVRI